MDAHAPVARHRMRYAARSVCVFEMWAEPRGQAVFAMPPRVRIVVTVL